MELEEYNFRAAIAAAKQFTKNKTRHMVSVAIGAGGAIDVVKGDAIETEELIVLLLRTAQILIRRNNDNHENIDA